MMRKVSSSDSILYQIYFFLILFTYSDGFGLRGDGAWGGLGNSSMGPFALLQLTLFAFSVYLMLGSGRSIFCASRLSKSTKLFLLLFVLITIELLFQSLFSLNLDKLSKYANLIELKSWILLFSAPALYNKIGIKSIVNVLKICGVISAVVVFYVLFFNIQGTAIKTMIGMSADRALRVIIPTASIIVLAYFLCLSSYKQTKSIIDVAGALICFLGTFIQLHRSSTFALLLVTALFIIMELKFRIGSYVIIIAGGIFLLGFVFNKVGYSFETLFSFFTESREMVKAGEDAGASMRFGMIANAISFVISNFLIIGIGLDWEPIEDTELYNLLQFAETPTLDNGYYNIIIVFGILGLLLFLNMLLRLIIGSYKHKKNGTGDKNFIIISSGVFFYLLYTSLVSMGNDCFLLDLIFPIVIGIVLMNEKVYRTIAMKS